MPTSGAPLDPLFLDFQLALAGRYSIDRELGRGGMGVVYLAREVHLDRLVAIKLLPPARAAQAELRERFLREARLAAKLSHPNIIPIHAVEDTAGFVFYVMSYVDGETLAQRVRTRGPLPSAEGARVLREIAWALAFAHAQGVVHRDVKPDNIMLESATGRVLVTDFGIAAAIGDTVTSGVAGTPEFMSPEQALGGTVDARSDLYALGATAFFAFSGRFPFEGGSATEILARQVTEAPPSLASLGLAVPRSLVSLIERCLAKSPEQRPADARALAEQLGVAIQQRRELPVALRAFVKRSGRLDGGGTLLAVIGLLFGSLGTAAIFGPQPGFATLVAGLTVGPFIYFVGAARRLLLLGFSHQDLGPAFKSEMEQAREELSIASTARPSKLERGLAALVRVSGTVFALSAVALPFPALLPYAGPTFGIASGATTIAAITLLLLRQRHRDVDTEMWATFWMGRVGKLAFSIARRLLGARAPASAMTHRATELSLSMAAEQLFERLPRATRQSLGDVPALLRRLEGVAQSLRARHDELQGALEDAAESAASPQYDDVREARDAVHAKLADAVGALETIRLDLLRLHAGSLTVAGLSTHLGLAAEVSAEVERLIAAQREVERILPFPRQGATTPV